MQLQLPSSISVQDFLDHYWQKQPLLMRNAIQNYDFYLTPEELAGLACEEEVESRMVLRHGEQDWELRHGPFDEETFTRLPDQDWTLLVQDVDKYLPEVAQLLQAFQFIPSWRFDDIMVSYAVTGGSVGPHTDTYDVFLIQASGKRRWQIGNRAGSDALLPDLPVRILEKFAPEETWTLEPGDVLYLPLGVAHWGVAEDADCMTWSVGLRAPSVAEMLGSFTQFLLDHVPESLHFKDPPLHPQDSPSEIQPAALTTVGNLLQTWLSDMDLQQQWFGCFSTEIKEHLFIEQPEQTVTAETLLEKLLQESPIHHPFSRYAWSKGGDGSFYLFVCGEMFKLPPQSRAVLMQLCDDKISGPALTAACQANKALLEAVTEIVNQGWLDFGDD